LFGTLHLPLKIQRIYKDFKYLLSQSKFYYEGFRKSIINSLRKLFQPFSQDARDQYVFAYNHIFVSIIQSYDCKQIPVGLLHVEKMADVVLLNVYRIGFRAYLLWKFTTILNLQRLSTRRTTICLQVWNTLIFVCLRPKSP
jgi:hypothetical protein